MPAHFELHVDDTARARRFYGDLLGWTFTSMPMGDYHLVSGDGIGLGQPLSGALTSRNAPAHPAGSGPRGAVRVFTVGDVDDLYARALASGGAEAMPPQDFEGIGRLAYCEDGEGNLFGMIQPPKGAP
jgi:predicted enzyme related to lactoylglutathione lyase